MQGYPYQRLSDPRKPPAPTPAMVGQMLVNKGMGANPSPMGSAMASGMGAPMAMPPMGAPSGEMEGMEMDGEEMGEMPEPMMDRPLGGMGAMPMACARVQARGMEGDYDPMMEHSISSTRVALDNAVRAQMGRMQSSERRMTPTNTREVLTRLGMPPLEVDLALRSGNFGDSES